MNKIKEYLKYNPPVLFYGLAVALLIFAALVSAACMSPVTSAVSASAPREAVIVEPTESLSAPTAEALSLGEPYTVCHNANIRPNPSATDRVLGWKMRGEGVVVLDWSGAWARIGDSMYINGWLLCPQKEASRVR